MPIKDYSYSTRIFGICEGMRPYSLFSDLFNIFGKKSLRRFLANFACCRYIS